ncbi:acylphosphatase [Olivibacter sitiensis]|uniref:acylphosphatase n=1 Tax=Olivibacter sitiensis TaxID=376470 RepID=UPI000480EB30|nr:acylphosphatase [Olivibacter sitiensis]
MPQALKHLDILVHGKVQKVYYRASTKAVADVMKIRGTVKNLPNGSVQIEAEGNPLDLESFLEWCHEGPEDAQVTQVEVKEGELRHHKNFVVVKR